MKEKQIPFKTKWKKEIKSLEKSIRKISYRFSYDIDKNILIFNDEVDYLDLARESYKLGLSEIEKFKEFLSFISSFTPNTNGDGDWQSDLVDCSIDECDYLDECLEILGEDSYPESYPLVKEYSNIVRCIITSPFYKELISK